MDNTDKATERQLRDYDQAGVISVAKVVKTADGYVLVIQVSWKHGDLIVFNQRGKPRAWVSLDRLLAHLADVAPTIRTIELSLDASPEWAKPEKPVHKKPAVKRAAPPVLAKPEKPLRKKPSIKRAKKRTRS